MRRAVFGGICWAVLTCGCADYMPITEEDFVSISIQGGNDALGQTVLYERYRGFIDGCIGPSTAIGSIGFICDRRLVSKEYDPDRFVLNEDEFGSHELLCYPPEVSEQTGSHCVASVLDADPGREFRFTVNEYTESKVTMPSVPTLTLPELGRKVSVSGEDLALSWQPISTGDSMLWEVDLDYFETGDTCYELALMTGIRFGDVADSGFLPEWTRFYWAVTEIPTNRIAPDPWSLTCT